MYKSLIDLIVEGIDTFFNFLIEGVDSFSSDNKEHNATFGKASKIISSYNKGWCVDGKRFLDIKTSRQNFCVVAGSGKGKTQVHIFPTLLHSDSSMVVNDNSGELEKAVPHLMQKGAIPLVMDLTKKSGVYLNPLDGCKGNNAAIRKISKSLMSSVSKENDFFSVSGEDCLSLFIQYVLESESRIHANLGNVHRLILEYQGSPDVVERLFADKASQEVWTKFLALAGNSERTLKSITATALSALSWLGDNPTLADITSVSNISFEAFRKHQHVLFIQSPVSDASLYAPMVSLVFQSFYRFAFSKLPSEDDLDIMMILDEFSSLIQGLPEYSNTISNSRKFKIPQCIVLQDESLLSPYKELKDNILGNCFVKCYYGGQDKKAFELEKLLGNYSYEDKESKNKKTRPLMYASEIRELDTEILVIPNGQKSLKVKITPAYKQRRLRKKLALRMDDGASDQLVDYSIQYIDLTPYRVGTKKTITNN